MTSPGFRKQDGIVGDRRGFSFQRFDAPINRGADRTIYLWDATETVWILHPLVGLPKEGRTIQPIPHPGRHWIVGRHAGGVREPRDGKAHRALRRQPDLGWRRHGLLPKGARGAVGCGPAKPTSFECR